MFWRDKEKMSEIILNYRCKNGHKWKSKEWPMSTFIAALGQAAVEVFTGKKSKYFNPTICPECGTEVCMCQSEDGKQGAMHIEFGDKNES